MKKIAYFLCVWLAAFPVFSVPAQERAEIVVEKKDKKTPETLYKGSYALVIGESEYTGGWQNLPGVAEDVPAVKTVLEKRGFTVRVKMNLTRDELKKAIETFIDDYGYELENRLLIYFAGHGSTLPSADNRGKIGYIVPVDAPLSKPDEAAFKRKAIPRFRWTILKITPERFKRNTRFLFSTVVFRANWLKKAKSLCRPL
jgi:hypothetical protein